MTSLPPSTSGGSLVPESAMHRLLGETQQRHRAHCQAAKALLQAWPGLSIPQRRQQLRGWIDGDRAAHGEGPISDKGLDLALLVTPHILEAASSPLVLRPELVQKTFELDTIVPTVRQPLTTLDPNVASSSRLPNNTANSIRLPKRRRTEDQPHTFYIRYIEFVDVQHLANRTSAYIRAYPDDAVWATLVLEECAEIPQKQPVWLSYVGQTVDTAVQRVHDDLWGTQGRFGRMLAPDSALPADPSLKCTVYTKSISPGLGNEKFANRIDLQDLERVLVASHHLSLNVTRGGERFSVSTNGLPTCLNVGENSERDAIAARITAHFEAQEALWRTGETGPAITPTALDEVIDNASNFDMTLIGNRVSSVQIGTAISDQHHRSMIPGHDRFGPLRTTAADLDMQLRELHAVRLDTKAARGAFINLWSTTIDTRLSAVACLLLSRYLDITRPLLLRTASSKVAGMLLDDTLHKIWANFDDSPTRVATRSSFLDCTFTGSLSLLNTIIGPSQILRTSFDAPAASITDHIGVPRIVRTGFTSDAWTIVIPNFDAAYAEKDPLLAPYIIRVMDITAKISAVAESVLASRAQNDTPREWFATSLRRIVYHTGNGPDSLSEQLTSAKNSYRAMCTELVKRRAMRGPIQQKKPVRASVDEPVGTRLAAEQWQQAKLASLLVAEGEPGSLERTQQADRFFDLYKRLRHKGTFGTAIDTPPWIPEYTPDQMKEWLVSRPRGYNIGLGVRGINTNETKRLDPAGCKEYAISHLGIWATKGHQRDRKEITLERDLFSAMTTLADPTHFAKTPGNSALVTLSCDRCERSYITTGSGQHICPEDESGARSSSSKHGLTKTRYVYAHRLAEHPVHGLGSLDKAEVEKLLVSHNLKWMDSNSILQDAVASKILPDKIFPNIPNLPKILCRTDLPKNIALHGLSIAAAGSRLIAMRQPRSNRDYNITVQDDHSVFGSGRLAALLRYLEQTEPLYTVCCASRPDCGYRMCRPRAGGTQHSCSSAGGVLRPVRFDAKAITAFDQLPTMWQDRVWLSYAIDELVGSHGDLDHTRGAQHAEMRHMTWRAEAIATFFK